jgi:predicted RNA binding protein YcfA (HicA-like mRNA interferase family)
MARFPIDAPRDRVIKAFERLGFRLVREGNHMAMVRENPDGTRTPLTMPNHRRIKGSTLRTILTQAGIPRDAFLAAYEQVCGATFCTSSVTVAGRTTHCSCQGKPETLELGAIP